jgi:hypothetical protein
MSATIKDEEGGDSIFGDRSYDQRLRDTGEMGHPEDDPARLGRGLVRRDFQLPNTLVEEYVR